MPSRMTLPVTVAVEANIPASVLPTWSAIGFLTNRLPTIVPPGLNWAPVAEALAKMLPMTVGRPLVFWMYRS